MKLSTAVTRQHRQLSQPKARRASTPAPGRIFEFIAPVLDAGGMQQELVYLILKRYQGKARFARLCDEAAGATLGPSVVRSALTALRASGRVVGYRAIATA